MTPAPIPTTNTKTLITMFEDLQVVKSITYNTVTASITGNPYTVKAIIAEEDGKFHGASFIEVYRRKVLIPDTGITCNQYGIVHEMQGDEADELTAVCQKLTHAIEQEYGFEFEPIPEPSPIDPPVPPEPEEPAESEETQEAGEGQE